MARTLIVAGDPISNTQNFGTTEYRPISGNCGTTTVEADAQEPIRAAGTFDGLSVTIGDNTVNGSTTFRLRKNATNGNQTFSISSSTTGKFQDLTHTDTVAAGDLVAYTLVAAGTSGTISPSVMSITFDTTTPTTLSVTRIGVTAVQWASNYTGASTTYYKQFTGWFEDNLSIIETSTQLKMQYAGTFKNFAVRIPLNNRTTTTTYRVRKGAANTTVTVAFTSTQTGTVQDTTNSFTVVAGDLVNFSFTNGTGTLVANPSLIAVEFHSTTDPGLGLLMLTNPTTDDLARATTYYQPIGGAFNQYGSTTTEAYIQAKAGEPWKFKGLQGYVISNGITSGSTTITLRVNGANSALTASIAASTSGWFQDTTHTVTVATGDLLAYSVVTGTGSGTQTIGLRTMGMSTEMAGSTSIDMTPNAITLRNKKVVVV